jgi:hypothetical protein
MSNLRNEFNKKKEERQKYINEAAYKWVESNVILINERIDRKTVKRLSDSIVKFDEKFGPFKDKIPALSAHLDAAEHNLQLVVTGKVNDKKASDMLKQLNYLYREFSEFFNVDLPILLNTNIFASAKQNPDVRLDSIQPTEGTKHDPAVIRDAIQHALNPTKDEIKLSRKIYSSKNIVEVDSKAIATQLLALSFNELQNLTGIEKVPMVATEEEPAAMTAEGVDHNKQQLNEVDLQKLKILNNDISRLQKAFSPFASKLPSLTALIKQMKDQMAQVNNSAGSGAWDKIKSMFGGGVQKQILATHDIFRNFKQIAIEIVKMMDDAPTDQPLEQLLDDPEIGQRASNALQMLGKAVKPGLFGKSAIDPNTFKDELSKLSLSEINSLANGIELPPAEQVNPELDNPTPEQGNAPAAQQPAAEPVEPFNVGDVQLNPPKQPKAPPAPETRVGAPTDIEAPSNTPDGNLELDTAAVPAKKGTAAPAAAPAPVTPAAQTPAAPAATPEQPAAPSAAPAQAPATDAQAPAAAPGAPLTPDQVIAALTQKKKVGTKIQKDLQTAVDYLNKNGFKITQ